MSLANYLFLVLVNSKEAVTCHDMTQILLTAISAGDNSQIPRQSPYRDTVSVKEINYVKKKIIPQKIECTSHLETNKFPI